MTEDQQAAMSVMFFFFLMTAMLSVSVLVGHFLGTAIGFATFLALMAALTLYVMVAFYRSNQ